LLFLLAATSTGGCGAVRCGAAMLLLLLFVLVMFMFMFMFSFRRVFLCVRTTPPAAAAGMILMVLIFGHRLSRWSDCQTSWCGGCDSSDPSLEFYIAEDVVNMKNP
jgi:hypothetical protein